MKKLTLLLILVLLTACTPAVKKIVEVGGEASCVKYEIHDENGNSIEMPEDITESLECATDALKISPDSKYLLYDTPEALHLYNFVNGDSNLVYQFTDDMEGVSCVWDKSGQKFACAMVNQLNKNGATKIIVAHFENDNAELIGEFFQPSDKMMDFICGASCYPGDFWFEDENTIKYKGHSITFPDQEFEINI